MKRNCLFISYDGMTDPLGSSQVIPYLAGLAKLGHRISILSCEKPERLRAMKENISTLLNNHGIQWHPLTYHKRPPVLSTVYDTWCLYRKATELVQRLEIDSVHCRSYIPSLIGLWLKRKFGLGSIFDMRGFWADERVDGNLWNLKNPLYWAIYKFFKSKERDFLLEANATVSLTHAGKSEMERWPAHSTSVAIIPCCVDLQRFNRAVVSNEALKAAREKAGLASNEKVLLYLGSIGTWYLLDEMLAFFRALSEEDPSYRFLFVTPDAPSSILERAGNLSSSLKILSARHEEVPTFLALADLGVFFIRPSYSKKSSSPTKLGEMLAMGLPVFANAGVGDVDYIFQHFPVGHLLPACNQESYRVAAARHLSVAALPRPAIRAAAETYFSLQQGVEKYAEIYERLPPGGGA